MKKLFQLFVIVLTLFACGSSKKLTNNLGEELSDSKAHKAWMIDTSTRAIGNGQHFREQAAINIAELQARAALARKMATAIKYSIREEFGGDQKFTGTDEAGKPISDQSSGGAERAEAISEEIVKNAEIIEISRFKLNNSQYNVYVCVGYTGGKTEMAEKAFEAMEQLIPDDQKQKLREDRAKIIEGIKKSFNK